MARKAYNPYVVQNTIINRFRGIVNADNPFTLSPSLVGDISGMVSERVAEIGPQPVDQLDSSFSQPIYSGARTLNFITICAGPSVWVEEDSPDTSTGVFEEDQSYAAEEKYVATNRVASYRRSVFSGVDRPWIGLDHGKGIFYNGRGVHQSFSLVFGDSSFQPEEGDVLSESFSQLIYSGCKSSGYVTISSGSSIWVDL